MAINIRLKKGQHVNLVDGSTVTAIGKLGEGGQGIVYRVRVDRTGEEKALKWYFPSKLKDAPKFRERLAENIAKGAPSPFFVWPETLTVWLNGTFGYIMRIYPSEYQSFPKYLLGRVKFGSTMAMVNAGLNIVTAFKDLHNAGLNYQDLNDGNFSIEPKSGDVLICDNDNVVGHGMNSGILGKARYIAPETVRDTVANPPDKLTDRFSLAVVLFLLLTGNHPLEGGKTNVAALTNKFEKRFFGTEPVFIYDLQDSSNRPVPGLHRGVIAKWKYYPGFIKTAFQQSFSQDSLLKAEGRLLEQQWIHLFMNMKSALVKCPHCHDEIFLGNGSVTNCPNCGKSIPVVGWLQFSKRSNIDISVPIFPGVRLYSYHMRKESDDYNTPVAIVRAKSGKYGLQNSGQDTWTVTSPNGKSVKRTPGETTVLGDGFKIDFGQGNVAVVMANK